ncbi:hypothetical protein PRUPE_4G272200 [Prunus persica]|uniref:Uncharacterized protein n=1 Tax=Prunus persica TaxID=3760 RepID=A0A251PRT3_PRUPE|nr:hypothetical protein PRUPE_4G272200 [Prunus persica]
MNAPSFFISNATAIISVSIFVDRRHTSSSFSSIVESERRQPQQLQRIRKVFRFAFAIVSGETVNNWRWFLQKISDVLLGFFLGFLSFFV